MIGNSFNAVEILEMAKNIEERGYNFYTKQAEQSSDEDLKKLFLKLAEDEKDHYKQFDEFLDDVKAKTWDESEYVYDPEVGAYLRAIVEFEIFSEEETDDINNTEEALRVAVTAEKDSILFYDELLKYNRGEAAKFINDLIVEERKHFLDLVQYKKKLEG